MTQGKPTNPINTALLLTIALLGIAIVVLLVTQMWGKASSSPALSQATPQTLEAIGANLPQIALDPIAISAPIGSRAPKLVRVDLEAVEVEAQLAEGTSYTYYTFGGAVPGPFLRVKLGDTVEVHFKNRVGNSMMHSVDFHAATGFGGGGAVSQAMPGETKIFSFKAMAAGLFVYHCATPLAAQHITNGQYGLILVEPAGGLPKVDREFYVMQGELYTTAPNGTPGRQQLDSQKLLAENPEFFVFNGATNALTEQHPLKAKVGETIRIFFGVGGPNFISTFHVIGEIFDKVYDQASLTNPLTHIQSALTGPGSASIVELKLDYPGRFLLVDHALSRAAKGLLGHLLVEGKADPTIFKTMTPVNPGGGH